MQSSRKARSSLSRLELALPNLTHTTTYYTLPTYDYALPTTYYTLSTIYYSRCHLLRYHLLRYYLLHYRLLTHTICYPTTCFTLEIGYLPSTVLHSQGEAGQSFVLIREGEAKCYVQGNEVAHLKSGNYAGERSLLYDEPRGADVVVVSKVGSLRRFRISPYSLSHRFLHCHIPI